MASNAAKKGKASREDGGRAENAGRQNPAQPKRNAGTRHGKELHQLLQTGISHKELEVACKICAAATECSGLALCSVSERSSADSAPGC